ncbi:MAG: 3-oxoacyl-(acyl-carrier-protein) reductase FabG [Planctomycetes bacterium ADurb.Bin126]|nr:MAG: 3-oxoacyl-(acyl-carrier-protein) reductase FabG [Planctomycetes bacterium ADurb.Bin126]HOD83353.1 SDR family oxidoreductase [Phycisphaerae bacterium]HQL76107.1 SDR family oxidoreductase [Phycisphaerae bacterium]
MIDLSGKIALVTGASQRLGKAIATALARSGADVALHYHASADAARAAADELRALGRRVELFQADLAQPERIEALFAQVRDAFGRLDILVNNAARYERTPIDTLTAEQWDAQMALDARAPALCIRFALPLMPAGSAVVNITDVSADRPWGGYVAYCAAKAALQAVTRAAARALAPRSIRVNAVAPGAILWQDESPDDRQAVLRHVPLGRTGTPDDVAQAVLFLAANDYVTGQTLRVDGGWVM